MPDKLTDSEIMGALKHCANGEHCSVCGFRGITGTVSDCSKNFLDLINRLRADIKKLTSGKCVYLSDDETTEYCVEGSCPKYKTEVQIKAEAYKECIEQVEKIICENTYPDFDKDGKAVNVWKAKEGYGAINRLKETVGDSNG